MGLLFAVRVSGRCVGVLLAMGIAMRGVAVVLLIGLMQLLCHFKGLTVTGSEEKHGGKGGGGENEVFHGTAWMVVVFWAGASQSSKPRNTQRAVGVS